MAEGRRYGLALQLDIDQILMEAHHRWLRPAEICEILKNYQKFRIAPEPPNRPQSGSLFLFDRKMLRYFRKDGHNWRKKKDGKNIKEAHERLKVGSVDVLDCYYAHGEDNEFFQRRSYWMLEEHLLHIVLVHYLEVKGGRSNLHRIIEVEHSNNADSPLCSTSFTSQNNLTSQNTEAESSISGQTSEYEDAESDPNNRITDVMYLSMRLEKLITLGPNAQQISLVIPTEEKQELSNKITLLMSESDEWSNLLKLTDEGGLGFLDENPKDELVERSMKEKLHLWLLHKVNEEGKGPCVLDKEGQGVIHLTAALGYDWAIRPTITAGVNINFRDAHGWTALHWAAFCGRGKTVVALIALGAAHGLLTDPTPEFPSGRTPADLASSNNHKGISGFLAESSLTSLLEILILKDSKCADLALMHTVQTGATDVNIPTDDGSLKDSLSAVRNAAITRARIYQVFRMQSFQRKQPKEFDDDVLGISGEWAMAMAPAKLVKASPGNKVHLAATRIQNKFCGHKRRKEFLLIKQHIVKIQGYLFITPQAHMRGHQVRKHYRKIVRSVGIVEKIILRWRCRGSGLRGFQFDGPSLEGPSNVQIKPAKDDDDLDETIESFQRSPPVGDSPVYGRENEKNSIIGFLLSDDFNRSNLTVVCIVGESGIGKTSLAHLIYSEERILDSFDARVFITMPEKSDETRLIKKLIESITSSPCPMTEADLLEELLIDELSGTKVFVVLDDADNENPCFWNRIVTILNHSTRGSILLVTTKSEDVAEVIGAMRTHFLDPLSDNYCWKLFWQHIFTGLNTNANTDLVEIGKQLVSKCQHNLLCIKVLAGLLVCLKNVESWVEILKTDLWNMDGFDGDTLPILRMCYETLPDNLKKCLHYCSLFPKDYVFAKQQIVRMWMSQGFIVSVEGRQPEEAGLQNFDELLLRGFFQHSPLHDVEEDKYIMHDLIRALATHFSRTECASAEDAVERTLVNCFHFSLNPSVIQIDKMKPLIKEASDLQSFLVLSRLQTRINISILDITSLNDLFTKFINLRTLDLSCTDIVELPSSVGMLKQLRYLGVNNTKIRSIPRELCSLVSLQTLEAKDCQHLVELPESMMELTNLRHLDVSRKSGCVKMMIGIGQLTNLQSLAVFCVGCEMPYCSIRELKDLNCLSSCLQIAGLENITYGLDAKEAALHNKVHLNTLWLHWNDNRTCIESEESVTISEEVLKNLKPNPNIGELIIRNYRGNLFPTWMGDSSFSKLVSIILDKCLNCSQFPALGGLPSLRHLSVQKLYHLVRLENTDSQFVSKNTPKFPFLETLNLWEMYDLEELFVTSDCDFPCLHTLSISRCPMLKSVPCFSSLMNLSLYCCVKLPYLPDFPLLKSLRIDGFQKIKSLELPNLPALKELEIRHCNELILVEGLPKLPSLEKLNVVHCPNFDPFKTWKPCHSKPISTTSLSRFFFQKEESTTQMEHQETTEPAEKHTEVVVASLDDSKKRTNALRTAEPAEKRTKALKTAEPVKKHTKMVVQLGSLDDYQKQKALITVVGIKGIKSASLDGNRLAVVCDGTDPVAMITLLRIKLGHADLLSVTSGDERIREEQENKISSGSNSLYGGRNSLAEPAEKCTKALKTAEPVEKHTKVVVLLGSLDDYQKQKAIVTFVGIQGIKSASFDGNQVVVVCDGTDLIAMITLLRKKLGYAELVSVTSGDERIREEQENKISRSGSEVTTF